MLYCDFLNRHGQDIEVLEVVNQHGEEIDDEICIPRLAEVRKYAQRGGTFSVEVVLPLLSEYDTVLMDDVSTPYGGTDYIGETVLDFLQSVGYEWDGQYIDSLQNLDMALAQCGMRRPLWPERDF